MYLDVGRNEAMGATIFEDCQRLCDSCNQIYILKQKKSSDFHGTVSFDPVKMSQQKQNVYQTSDTQKLVII